MRRPAIGGVRAVRRPRPDRRRRGARLLLQAGGRPALRRARGGRAARRARGRAAAGRQRDAATRESGALRAPRVARARGRAPAAARRDRADGRRLRAVPRAHARGAGGRQAPRREGDRPAQPARLVELPLLPAVRARLGVPALRRDARPAPGRGRAGLPPLRPPRPPCRRCARTAAPCRWRATAPGPSSSSASSAGLVDPLPVFRLDSDVAARSGIAGVLRRVRGSAGGRARGDADGGEGARLPRRHARRRAGRRRHAALPRLPRRGAHVRARGPARRAQRSRRARRARDRAGARPGRPLRCGTPPGTTRAASSRTSCRGARRSPIRPTGT